MKLKEIAWLFSGFPNTPGTSGRAGSCISVEISWPGKPKKGSPWEAEMCPLAWTSWDARGPWRGDQLPSCRDAVGVFPALAWEKIQDNLCASCLRNWKLASSECISEINYLAFFFLPNITSSEFPSHMKYCYFPL